MRVVVLGGTGNFGARIVRALRHHDAMELIAASRTGRAVEGAEEVETAGLDSDAQEFAVALRALRPEVVIHCVGPFQGQDYRVPLAALSAGAHYIDLADGRAFVGGFAAAVGPAARAAGRCAITGASTLPALSSAVIGRLAEGLQSVETLEIVIAPGQRAPRGRATLEAVFSYLGQPFAVRQKGRWRKVYGWMDLRRVALPIGTRWAAACDVPDLSLLVDQFPGIQTVRFHAALELGVQHVALCALASARRWLGVPAHRWAVRLGSLAGGFDRWAGAWGGMLVRLVGVDPSGRRRERLWQLQTPAIQGPEIPTFAAILLASRWAKAEVGPVGAFPCVGCLPLAAFAPMFESWGMSTRIEERAA